VDVLPCCASSICLSRARPDAKAGGRQFHKLVRYYLLYILKTAYKEFESRAMGLKPVRGEKRTRILKALESLPETFSMAELAAQCTGISLETVRKTIKGLRIEGKVVILKAGRDALWRKTKN
jgi:Fic family protein